MWKKHLDKDDLVLTGLSVGSIEFEYFSNITMVSAPNYVPGFLNQFIKVYASNCLLSTWNSSEGHFWDLAGAQTHDLYITSWLLYLLSHQAEFFYDKDAVQNFPIYRKQLGNLDFSILGHVHATQNSCYWCELAMVYRKMGFSSCVRQVRATKLYVYKLLFSP